MEGFSVDNVLLAVQSMYGNTPLSNYKEIDTWLKTYQKSSDSWRITDTIFSSLNLPEYVYIFNAQTLKTKLIYDFEELKGLDLSPFKSNILSLCLKFASQEKVMRQLAQSIGILAIHLVDTWGESMLSEISAAFSGSTLLLLEVLKSIAEEINNQNIVVDVDKANKLKLILERQASQIIRYLEGCSSEFYATILEVFLAWVQFGIDADVAATLPRSRLLQLSFDAVKIPERFDTACGVLCELISLTEDYEKYGETVQVLVKFLIGLKEDARKALQDEAIIDGYIKLYTSLGNAHMNRIIEEQSREVLEFLAELFYARTAEGIYQLSQFWHRFCRIIQKKPQEEKIKYQELTSYLMEILLPICMKQYQLSPEELNSTVEKDTEEIRYNVSVVLQDIIKVLSQEKVLQLFGSYLSQILSQDSANTYEKYSQIEAIAGCVISMAELCKDASLTGVYLQLSREVWPVAQVNVTVCKVFSAIISPLPGGDLPAIMNYLINCLKAQVSAKDVAMAVKNICIVNTLDLQSDPAALLQLHTLTQGLPGDPQEILLEGIAAVIWRTPIAGRAIFDLCSVYTNNLVNEITEEVLLGSCDKLAVIFKNANDKDIDVASVYTLFKEMWPGLKELVGKYQNNDSAVEALCRIVKHAMKKLQLAFGEFLEDFTQIISQQFLQYRHSSYLYMAEQLVRIFANSNVYQDLLINLFSTLSFTALTELNSPQSLASNPELTEDFFGMSKRYLNYLPDRTLQSQNFEKILVLAKVSIGLQHLEAAKCLYAFLECTFDYCNKESHSCVQYAVDKLLPHFRDVLMNLVAAVVTVVPGSIFEFIEEICFKILTIEEGAEWLALALVNVPHDCLTETEKVKFIQQSRQARDIHNWLERLYKRSKQRARRLY